MSLEQHLESLIKTDKAAGYLYAQYRAVSQYLEERYYPWVQAAYPYYTDHGAKHIKSVMMTASHLTADKRKNPETSPWRSLDLYILLAGIIWHDVGRATRQNNHADASAEIAQHVRDIAFPNPSVFNAVSSVVKAHSGENGLRKAHQEDDCIVPVTMASHVSSSREIAAVLRFSDEISETSERVSPEVMVSVPRDQRVFWEYASSVMATRPDPSRNRIVVTFHLEIEKAIQQLYHPGLKADTTLIEYIARRLERMNRERCYCSHWFRALASPISFIDVRLTLCHKRETIITPEDLPIRIGDEGLSSTGSYPKIDIFEHFFEEFYMLTPDNLRGRIT